MPIGSTYVYNSGDLILSTVSGSGTSFNETKIAAATSSLILFNNNGTLTSASLNSITVGTASYVSGSTSIIANLTASNISASGTGSFGMVGIGTTSPAAKLEIIHDSTAVTPALYIKGGYSGNAIARFERIYGVTPTTTYVDINGSGGNAQLSIASANNTFALGVNNTASAFEISDNSVIGTNTRLLIDVNGNVGIGTTSPTARLHVSGSTIITGSLNVTANITCLSLTETSTEAVKYNILPLPSQLDNVLKLKPVSFNYKANDKHSIGLIAEEVAKIYPEFTSDNNDSISYGKITSVLIQSIKELKTIIDNQQKQIENLINKLK
jgi:hypothetical protein